MFTRKTISKGKIVIVDEYLIFIVVTFSFFLD